jgi:hypothetical protein
MPEPLSRLFRPATLTVVGAVTFCAGLLAGAPADLLAPALAASGLQARSLEGTVWSGSALGLSAGDLRIDRLQWRLAPTGLLRARLQADLEATLGGNGFANGTVAVGPGGVAVRDVTAAAPLRALVPAAAALGPGAQLQLKVEAVDWRDGWIAAAVGRAEVVEADIAFGAAAAGMPRASFAVSIDAPAVAAGEPVTGELRDTGGPLELSGTVTLKPPLEYAIDGVAKARPGAPPALAQGLALLGPPDPAGRHAISFAGSL